MKSTLVVALLFASAYLHNDRAAAQTGKVRATVPFAFTVGKTLVPAGTYVISATNNRELLRFESRLQDIHVAVNTVPEYYPTSQCKLVFHHYGNQYFLSQVMGGSVMGNISLPVQPAEKRARMQTELAAIPGGETVLVAMR